LNFLFNSNKKKRRSFDCAFIQSKYRAFVKKAFALKRADLSNFTHSFFRETFEIIPQKIGVVKLFFKTVILFLNKKMLISSF